MVAALSVVAVFAVSYYPNRQRAQMQRDAEARLQASAQALALALAVGLRFDDLAAVSSAMQVAKRDTTLVYALARDARGDTLAEFNPGHERLQTADGTAGGGGIKRREHLLITTVPIALESNHLGQLTVAMSLRTADAIVAHDRSVAVARLLAVSLTATLLAAFFADRIARPLVRLHEAADRFAAGDYDLEMPRAMSREVDALGHAFGTMGRRIRDAMLAMQHQAAALEESRDAALEAARAKTLFLATMSHEIRTPMTGILGMLDLLSRTSLTTRQRSFSRTARESAEALLAIIDQILDFSKIEAGKVELDRTACDVGELLEDVAALLAERAQRKGLLVICNVADDLPARTVVDVTRVRQVLLNLGGNAVKFTTQGTVTLSVRTLHHAQGGALEFEVRDTGIGIPPAAQARLFQPFSQADASTSRRFGGTGLGLSIVRRLVELMGGTIAVESAPGVGSRFQFTIPLASPTFAEPSRPLTGLRVLVVETRDELRQILVRYARTAGADVRGTSDCHAASAHLAEALEAQTPWDVVIADHDLASERFVADSLCARPALIRRGLVIATRVTVDDEATTIAIPHPVRMVNTPVRRRELVEALVALAQTTGNDAASAPPAPTRAHGGKRVLLVEDNEVNRRIGEAILQDLGLEVRLAEDGNRALEALDRESFDLVFMDCQMPGMDGFEATRRWRAREERRVSATPLPIVALTANAIDGDREVCLAAGMSDYVAKPYRRADIELCLSRWLGTPAPTTPTSNASLPTDDEVLDVAQLESLVGRQPDRVVHFLSRFRTTTAAAIDELRDLANHGDREGLRRLAHRIKGASSSVGARRLARVAEDLEAGSAALAAAALRTRVDTLAVEFEHVARRIDR